MTDFDKRLVKMVHRAGLETRNSYNTSEAADIIGVSAKTVERMIEEFEIIDGEPKPGTLQGFLARSTIRIFHDELVSFFERGAKAICE